MLLDSNPSLKNVYIILNVTWVKRGGQGDLHFDNFDVKLNILKLGVIFGVFQGAKLKSGLKKDVNHTGGHLGIKSGGQSDLHFHNFDVRRNIVK